MNINMTDESIISIAQIKELIKLENSVEFKVDDKGNANKQKIYDWLAKSIIKFRYFRLRKKDRGIVLRYFMKITGLSKGHIKKLVKKKKGRKKLELNVSKRVKFPNKYDTSDIQRLIDTDNSHDRLSGQATKRILEREYTEFNKVGFEKIRTISVSHIYNLRNDNLQYQSGSLTFKHTKAVQRDIGVRRKPVTEGKPGFLRVDTVHQGDLDKEKGVYHINMVDEETQWEIIGCVEGISERFLLPLLEVLLEEFPFKILGFHSDNGGEFINQKVSKMLQKIFVEQTKSRSRKSNDNGLVETKNGSIIRKHFGKTHIPKNLAKYINSFYKEFMYEYLNYHRPCGFATDKVSPNGKIVKKYDNFLTPFEKLKSMPNWESYLKPGITKEQLEACSKQQSDNECGFKMIQNKQKLFENLRKMQK